MRRSTGLEVNTWGPVMRDAVQLITYADRLGGSLPGLHALLAGRLRGLFGGVHVLPFFVPYDGADAGFDPDDHLAVDPRLGTWDDVRALAADFDVVADVIVNHISTRSVQFRDVLARGAGSPYAGMFLTMSRVFPHGATEQDLVGIYRPRPGLPFMPVQFGDGTRRLVWTTFGPTQVDIDLEHPSGQDYVSAILDRLSDAGVAMVRLDAVGYAVKTPGTSCFMTPRTHQFIGALTDAAHARSLEVLVEVHAHYRQQLAVCERVDRVYDFALPALVLHALSTGDPGPLVHWLGIRPANTVTVLDTHDGIGVVDVGGYDDAPGLLAPAEISALVEWIHTNSGGTSRLATATVGPNLDVYQVNCTYYDAVGRDDERYLLARLVQLFLPGVPEVYYVGLLAGSNDVELLRTTGVGREVNRHRFSPEDVADALRKPVVRALCSLIRIRNSHPAFRGEFSFTARGPQLVLRWDAGVEAAAATADFSTGQFAVDVTAEGRHQVARGVAALAAVEP